MWAWSGSLDGSEPLDGDRDRALSQTQLARAVAGSGVAIIGPGHALAPARLEAMRQAMLDDLAAFHQENADLQGLGRERLRLRLEAARSGDERPDADGIHSGALMLMFVYQYLRPLLDQGRVLMIHAPWVQISLTGQQPLYAYSEAQALTLTQQLRAQGKTPQVVRYRGLSGIDRAILMQTCIDPATRNARVMTEQDALAAIEIFGANV